MQVAIASDIVILVFFFSKNTFSMLSSMHISVVKTLVCCLLMICLNALCCKQKCSVFQIMTV